MSYFFFSLFWCSRWFLASHHRYAFRWVWFCSDVLCYSASTLSVYIGTYSECWLFFPTVFLMHQFAWTFSVNASKMVKQKHLLCERTKDEVSNEFFYVCCIFVFVCLLWLSTSHINLVWSDNGEQKLHTNKMPYHHIFFCY